MDGKRLKIYRVKNGLTLAEACRLIGIHQSALARIENGHCRPHELTVYKIYKAFPDAFRQEEATDEEFTRLIPETESWTTKPKQVKDTSFPMFSVEKKGKAETAPA